MIFPLVGNQRVKSAVCDSISANRLPHALLIEGDAGLGRHSLAEYIAAATVCTESDAPCGKCNSCHLATVGTHPDIAIVAPESGKKNIAVSQIRALRSEAFVKPHMAERRVFIIDFADSMNEQSQNALLKILEEPPGNVVFILIAESKSSLLDTILSRCAVLTLSAPMYQEAFDYITGLQKYDASKVKKALEDSQNNIGLALRILSGKGDTETMAAAKEYLNLMFHGNEYDLLTLTAPFEKSRITAELFFRDLKYLTACEIKNCLNNNQKAKSLSVWYDILTDYQQSLKTNVNLSLLFSATACKAKETAY